jgi:hypothetical protein
MPFTLCHPALVVPLHHRARRWTSLSALVIGSMAPDFVYFLPFGVHGGFSHSVPGLFLYCVPAGALAYAVYHALLRAALVEWAPPAIGTRMPPDRDWPPKNAAAVGTVFVSLLVGAASHLAWDAFTHAHTAVVQHVDALRTPVAVGGRVVPLFKILQHLSSLLGFLVLAGYAVVWYRRTEPTPPAGRQPSARQRRLVVGALALAMAAGGMAGLLLRDAASIERALFNVVTTGMAATALAILLLCLGWRFRYRAASKRAAGSTG